MTATEKPGTGEPMPLLFSVYCTRCGQFAYAVRDPAHVEPRPMCHGCEVSR